MNAITYTNRNDRYIPENINDDVLFTKLTIEEKSVNASIKDLSVNGLFLQLHNDLDIAPQNRIKNLKVIYNKELLFEGDAKIIHHLNNQNDYSKNLGVELLSGSINRIDNFLKEKFPKITDVEIENRIKLQKKHDIDKEFLSLINQLETYLQLKKNELDKIDENLMDVSYAKREYLHKFIINEEIFKFRKFHDEMYRKLNNIYFHRQYKQKKFYKQYSINKLRQYYFGSPIGKRTVEKPLGYSGDFIQVLMMFEDNSGSNLSLFDRLIHVFLQTLDPCVAHRNRIDYLYNMLKSYSIYKKSKNEQFKFMTLGCGPAMEIQKFSNSIYSENCKGFLVDMEPKALDFCKNRLNDKSKNRNLDLNYIHLNVKNISKSDIIEENCDVIYCAGLFDYINDDFCTFILQKLYEKLNKKGKLIFTNVTENRYFFLVDVLGDWILRIRDNDDFIRICDFVDIDKISIKYDETRSNAFIEISK